jgi:hypothetical protein
VSSTGALYPWFHKTSGAVQKLVIQAVRTATEEMWKMPLLSEGEGECKEGKQRPPAALTLCHGSPASPTRGGSGSRVSPKRKADEQTQGQGHTTSEMSPKRANTGPNAKTPKASATPPAAAAAASAASSSAGGARTTIKLVGAPVPPLPALTAAANDKDARDTKTSPVPTPAPMPTPTAAVTAVPKEKEKDEKDKGKPQISAALDVLLLLEKHTGLTEYVLLQKKLCLCACVLVLLCAVGSDAAMRCAV